MSNEEHLEEILYKAHKKGFYEELFYIANQIQKQNPKIGLYEKIDLAYTQIKTERLKNNENTSQH
jgi:hypothetical protein